MGADSDLPRAPEALSSRRIYSAKNVVLVPQSEWDDTIERLRDLIEENESLRRRLGRGGGGRSPKRSRSRNRGGARDASPISAPGRNAQKRAGRNEDSDLDEEPEGANVSGGTVQANGSDEEPAMNFSAAQLCSFLTEIYNRKIPSNQPLEKKGPEIERKIEDFMQFFDEGIKVKMIDGRDILGNHWAVKTRYQCVFTESGTELQQITHKRFFFETHPEFRSNKTTLCMDFETHKHIISAAAGTHPDGREGLTKPRTQNLVCLYICFDNKVQSMLMVRDSAKLGVSPELGEEALRTHKDLKDMFEYIKKEYPNHTQVTFQNYHNITTIG
ncbi:unnamed protein product [Amoebophrya sp. A120]|nr:unnamed protein product [Amoebophrya sp. A120]|eukprot:GSA120T00001814001.1